MAHSSIQALTPAPSAKKQPTTRVFHGDEVVDDYEWLREKENPEVLAYLEAENDYFTRVTKPLAALQEQIVQEIKSRTKEDDVSLPIKQGAWWYWRATREGQQYPVMFRCPAEQVDPNTDAYWEEKRPVAAPVLEDCPSGTQIVLDCNKMAGDNEFFSLLGMSISPNHEYVLVGVDISGDEHYQLQVYRIATGELVEDTVDNVVGGLIWSKQSDYYFYTRPNQSWRSYQVWRHQIGADVNADEMIYQEDDELFNVWIHASKLDDYIFITSASTLTSEVSYIPSDNPTAERTVIFPRQYKLTYQVDSMKDHFVILHNLRQKDFSVSVAPLGTSIPEQWVDICLSKPGERILSISGFQHALTVEMRSEGLIAVKIIPRLEQAFNAEKIADLYGDPWIVAGETLGGVELASNPMWETKKLLVQCESMIEPATVREIDLATHAGVVVKRQEVPNYDMSKYVTWREWATAEDGTRIPLTCVRLASVQPGDNPGFIYGYGSYEISTEPGFVNSWMSMVDRGVVCAIAHIRGGGEMGREWYENGKELKKINSFTDFIACADHLFATGWVAKGRLAARGGSAGGLLMGAVANMGTDRFRAIHAAVPFVDALTTILNPDLPITVGEWEEWGNPIESKEVYDYMKRYTPYENVEAKEYPAMLITTSLNDIRVFYTEPAKWMAKLRELATNGADRPLVMHCEMVAGHGGKTGRYNKWQETARDLSFLLDQIGAVDLL